ncbi:efflux RND transporter permease subunit [Thiohalobacter sp.]|uniref:efflux RND transporter permease subunit n=1 Tax=Thiohalobacter sp. TaxID=2025948 RepID=UPI002613747B|nr:efflux RND transporter permease subunit [Thiohalobacter sp.]
MSSARGPQALLRSGGLAAWSIRHPIGVTLIVLALVVVGVLVYQRLAVDLLPHIIYPEIRVRILDPGVPARIMEDQVTRQVEEQLAITEGAISVRSRSSAGASSVDLSFPYGTDIDAALRDASTRLDRAKRFLPDTIDPPIIYKRDPSQIPVAEFVVSSELRDPVALRDWVDHVFAKWFLNLPGVAAVEVGGGLIREIQVLPDLERLAAVGLTLEDLEEAIREGNRELPGGRLSTGSREYGTRTAGRFDSAAGLRELPLVLADGSILPLAEVAQVLDTHEDERLRVRFNRIPGVKISIQKQPTANTVAVVDAVNERLAWMRASGLLPADVAVHPVADQAVHVRQALDNARMAALSGALLAMLVVYLFLGDLRRTLIIGSAIPIALLVTFIAMALGGLTLNIMTLGGLAVGIGMLVDSTIVMLENIQRHQRMGEAPAEAGVQAAQEVNSAIVAATATNLAAILPFLFIGGLVGLLFRELIFTVASAVFAAMLVALTLVPAWAANLGLGGRTPSWRQRLDAGMAWLGDRYAALLTCLLERRTWQWLVLVLFVGLFAWKVPPWLEEKQIFLPPLDDGRVYVGITGDPGTALEPMDASVRRLEQLFLSRPEVRDVFVVTGGFIFGRTERELPSRASMYVQLHPDARGRYDSQAWIRNMSGEIERLGLAGYRVRMKVRGLRGLRVGGGDDDITLRIQGADLDVLHALGRRIADLLEAVPGLRNATFSGEEVHQELAIEVDRARAALLGLSVQEIGDAVGLALQGRVVSDYVEGDRKFDIRLRLPHAVLGGVDDLRGLVLFAGNGRHSEVRLGDVAEVGLVDAPVTILRDQQQRTVEVTASLTEARTLDEIQADVAGRLASIDLPDGYRIYDAGVFRELEKGRRTSQTLLGLALFLVFVVMAVQYESLRNPLVILLGVPFAATGAAWALTAFETPLSMPVWLGLIMLAGIVVNNAIVFVEYIELARERGLGFAEAVAEAGAQRLRPILMTTLTTVVGLLPLSLGLGQGSEMLAPLAQTMIWGLSYSLAVTLLLIPVLYHWLHRGERAQPAKSGSVTAV